MAAHGDGAGCVISWETRNGLVIPSEPCGQHADNFYLFLFLAPRSLKPLQRLNYSALWTPAFNFSMPGLAQTAAATTTTDRHRHGHRQRGAANGSCGGCD